MRLIEGVSSLEELEDCNLIIEAAFEELDVKTNLFQKIELMGVEPSKLKLIWK